MQEDIRATAMPLMQQSSPGGLVRGTPTAVLGLAGDHARSRSPPRLGGSPAFASAVAEVLATTTGGPAGTGRPGLVADPGAERFADDRADRPGRQGGRGSAAGNDGRIQIRSVFGDPGRATSQVVTATGPPGAAPAVRSASAVDHPPPADVSPPNGATVWCWCPDLLRAAFVNARDGSRRRRRKRRPPRSSSDCVSPPSTTERSRGSPVRPLPLAR